MQTRKYVLYGDFRVIQQRIVAMARAGTTIIGKQLLRNNLKQGRLLFFPFNYVAGCQRGVTTEINPDWNYEEERRTFQLKTPEYYNFARDVIDQWAEKERVRLYSQSIFLNFLKSYSTLRGACKDRNCILIVKSETAE